MNWRRFVHGAVELRTSASLRVLNLMRAAVNFWRGEMLSRLKRWAAQAAQLVLYILANLVFFIGWIAKGVPVALYHVARGLVAYGERIGTCAK